MTILQYFCCVNGVICDDTGVNPIDTRVRSENRAESKIPEVQAECWREQSNGYRTQNTETEYDYDAVPLRLG